MCNLLYDRIRSGVAPCDADFSFCFREDTDVYMDRFRRHDIRKHVGPLSDRHAARAVFLPPDIIEFFFSMQAIEIKVLQGEARPRNNS